jgi:hypothetical protein
MKFCAFLLGLVACFAGCSAKDQSPDPYATVSDFCAAWGKKACNSVVVNSCSGMDTTPTLGDSCVQSQRVFCEKLVNEHTGYSSVQAQTCLDAVGRAYADAKLTALEIATVRHLGDPCNHLFKGPQALGESCAEDADCDTLKNVQCVMKSGSGTCAIPTVVANGTSCSAPGAACMPGFYCSADENCVQSKTIGAKCTATFECATGLDCTGLDEDAGVTSGKCTARVSQTACTADSDCTTNVCDIATGASTGMCVNSIILAPTDGVCGDLR